MAQFVQNENDTCPFEQEFNLSDDYLDVDFPSLLIQ